MAFDPRQYWNARLGERYGLHGVGYLGLSLSYNRWMYRLRRAVFRSTVRAVRLRPDARVLDVGSGTGFYVQSWRSLGFSDVTGADLAPYAVARLAEQFSDVSFHELDIGAASLPDLGTFDAISCMDVLFHIVDDDRFARALHNVRRLLRPGGFFLWSDDYPHRGTVRGTHHVSRSLAEVERLLAEADLEIVSRRPMFVLMNRPVDARRPALGHAWWRVLGRAARGEVPGALTGAALYPVERVLVSVLHESPATEIMVCRPGRG